MIKALVKLADSLDKIGAKDVADQVDSLISVAQAEPQMSIAFTTAQEPITVANRWTQKRKMEQQNVKGPDKGQPTNDNVKEIITASATPTVPEWRGLLTYTFSITKPATGLINGAISLHVKSKLTPDQVTYLKNYMSKQVEEIDATKGAFKTSL